MGDDCYSGHPLTLLSMVLSRAILPQAYCPSDLPLRCIPPARRAVDLPGGRKQCCPEDLPLRSIPPTPYGVGPARLRPRVARVLRTTLLATLYKSASSLSNCHALAAGHLRPRVTRTLRTIPLSTGRISAPADSSRAVLNIPIQPLPSPYGPGHPVHCQPSLRATFVDPILLSSGMGPSTIVRFRTISYRRDALFQIAHTRRKDKHLITNTLQNGNV